MLKGPAPNSDKPSFSRKNKRKRSQNTKKSSALKLRDDTAQAVTDNKVEDIHIEMRSSDEEVASVSSDESLNIIKSHTNKIVQAPSETLTDNEAVVNMHFLRDAGFLVDCVARMHGGS